MSLYFLRDGCSAVSVFLSLVIVCVWVRHYLYYQTTMRIWKRQLDAQAINRIKKSMVMSIIITGFVGLLNAAALIGYHYVKNMLN